MKEMKKRGTLTDKDWEELASIYSGEKEGSTEPSTLKNDISETEKQWRNLRSMEDGRIDVDKAWNNVYSRISERADEDDKPVISLFRRSSFLKIAAAALLILSIGTITIMKNRNIISDEIAFVTGDDQRNLRVDLPDGSTVFLNRNSRLTYNAGFGESSRQVSLAGEAFFDITPNREKPFVIDAGKASVTVVGTSFSVLTENENLEVEVFVKTGKVLLSEKTGTQSVELEPGFIGKKESGIIEKSVNNDPNYLAWNTGKLVYNGEKLSVVFRDLKKYYNIDIIADDQAILEFPWTSPIDYEYRDKIIQLICTSFNLSYTKDGEVYHLSEK